MASTSHVKVVVKIPLLPEIKKDLRSLITDYTINVAKSVRERVRIILGTKIMPRTGKLVWRKVKGKRILHQQSARGEPPALLTGRLFRSVRVVKSRKKVPEAWFEVDAPYSWRLENPMRLGRPYVFTAVNLTANDPEFIRGDLTNNLSIGNP